MKKIRLFPVWIVIAALFAVVHAPPVFAFGTNGGDWPKEITVDGGSVVMYQPQPEELDGSLLKSRAAVSIKVDYGEEVVFGAVWFDARLQSMEDERRALVADVWITEVRFPDQQEEREQWLENLLESEMPGWNLEFEMDRLVETLELEEKRRIAAEKINTSPPDIIFMSEPAALVVIDGEPRLKKIENTRLLRVVNTPFTILLSQADRKYYLYAGRDTWYTSSDIKGNWVITSGVPAEVAVMAPQPDEERDEILSDDRELIGSGPPPVIIVSTEPAELISSYGEPEYTPISRTSLLYMSNTDSDVLLHIAEQRYYVLLAGRWYRSPSLNGPWEYVAGEDLPPDFSRIPEDSQMGTVLYAVPGTDLARQAVLDAHIPNTAAVYPDKASLTVEFDGKPRFELIQNTNLYYAVNTSIPVIWTGQRYYACDQAVWFVAPSPKGPWTVATYVPDAIYLIPPDSPVYNVTFVRVYDATPEVVYVGYTPGYTHTYVYHNTIVYGTGYNWPGWYGSYYYPRHDTWGYHPRWNPWSGWSFGLSYSAAPFYFSIGTGGWYRGGWWGPTHYRSYRHNYYHRYRREKHIGYRAGYVPPRPDDDGINIYRSRRNKVRLVPVHDRPILWGSETRVKEKWLQRDGGKPLKTRPSTGPVPIRKPKLERGKPLKTRPSTGPVPIRKPKLESGKPLKTRPSTGPVPTRKPKIEKDRPFETRPSTGPVPIRKPKIEKDRPFETRPSTGPIPTRRPKIEKDRPFETRPSTGPIPTRKPKLESGRSFDTRPSTGPIPIRKPKLESGRPLETRPSTGPVPIRKPKIEKDRPFETRPSTGPIPTRKPKIEKDRSFETRPSTGPVPIMKPKLESGRSFDTRPSTGPVPTRKPKLEKQRPMENSPPQSSAPFKRQKFESGKRIEKRPSPEFGKTKGVAPKIRDDGNSPRQKVPQFDRGRQQGEDGEGSFGGKSGSKGFEPERKGGEGRRR